jgi:hypothetical protein
MYDFFNCFFSYVILLMFYFTMLELEKYSQVWRWCAIKRCWDYYIIRKMLLFSNEMKFVYNVTSYLVHVSSWMKSIFLKQKHDMQAFLAFFLYIKK